MRLKTISNAIFGSLLVILLVGVACGQKTQGQVVSNAELPSVALPREVNNAQPATLKESSVIVSIPVKNEFYLGPKRISKEHLGSQVSQLLKSEAEADRIIFIACGASVEYGDVVDVINYARKAGIEKLGLLAGQQPDALSLFRVRVPAVLDESVDLTMLKPNPLTLVVSMNSVLKLRLNQEPMGDAGDMSKLTQKLTGIFQRRKELRAYSVGMETRTDAPEDERIEKTLVVKATRSTHYGQVVRIIDAVKGAGANPIVLQVDDLVE